VTRHSLLHRNVARRHPNFLQPSARTPPERAEPNHPRPRRSPSGNPEAPPEVASPVGDAVIWFRPLDGHVGERGTTSSTIRSALQSPSSTVGSHTIDRRGQPFQDSAPTWCSAGRFRSRPDGGAEIRLAAKKHTAALTAGARRLKATGSDGARLIFL